MTSKYSAWLMASAIAFSPAAPALAQYASPDPAYQQRLQTYGDQRADYEQRSADYQAERQAYEADRAQYERARARYDRRHGVGAYDRRYPQYAARYVSPTWRDRQAYEDARRDYDRQYGMGAYDRRYPDGAARFSGDGRAYGDNRDYLDQRAQYDRDRADYERARADYDRRYGDGAYDRRYPEYATRYTSPYAGAYGDNASYTEPCRTDAKKNAVAGGVIGALIGAVAGSNLAARNAKPEGTVLGAVVGAGVGAGIGNAATKNRCDAQGAYWTYDDTVPYRESSQYRASVGADYENYSRRCRLAPAPTDYNGRTETRYVRVCPDAEGRYRVQG
ncbi:glycine zipper 2TM domain-containing protein [Caulobacter sp. LARHSG274]